jgi:transposase
LRNRLVAFCLVLKQIGGRGEKYEQAHCFQACNSRKPRIHQGDSYVVQIRFCAYQSDRRPESSANLSAEKKEKPRDAHWQLTQLGVECAVVAPTLVPKKPGERVKTDRLDALKLARSHRSGDLTAVWVPDEDSESLRDLVRAREAAKQDQLRARHRLTKFLLRTGQRPPLGLKAWTEKYVEWIQQVHYTHPAREATLLDCLNEVQHMEQRVKRLEQSILEVVKLAPAPVQAVIQGLQALRGVAHISAVTIAAELGNISSRFESARKLMGYSGVFPSEDSSGQRIRRGSITKSGNAHLRRIVVESAWSYRHRPSIGARLRKRQEGVPAQITEIAWKAQNRLHKRYMKLIAAGKDQRKVMTAVGRELIGFIWAIGVKAEAACIQQKAA